MKEVRNHPLSLTAVHQENTFHLDGLHNKHQTTSLQNTLKRNLRLVLRPYRAGVFHVFNRIYQ